MKILVPALILLVFMSSCVSTTSTVEEKKPSQPAPPPSLPPKELLQTASTPKQPLSIQVQPVTELYEKEEGKSAAQFNELISDVTISTSSFNPHNGEEVAIYYTLSERAEVEVAFYDPDFALVRSYKSKGILDIGKHTLIWDGTDLDGGLIPDEAYFFTISVKDEKGNIEVYDPTVFSGGEGHDIIEADIDPDTKIITYKLPLISRVLIRIGVQDGPLLNILVDWKPRVAGEITEQWNGKDADNIIDLLNHPRFKMLITYFTLPENSIIAYGNNSLSYREYKSSLRTQRPVKSKSYRTDIRVSPHYQLPRTVDYSPKLKVTFSDLKGGEQEDISLLKDRTLVKIEIDETDKSFFINQQYEITIFLDTEFYSEQELGYVPFSWVWNLSDVEEGEHVLTVNMSGFKDQIGILSKRVRIIK